MAISRDDVHYRSASRVARGRMSVSVSVVDRGETLHCWAWNMSERLLFGAEPKSSLGRWSSDQYVIYATDRVWLEGKLFPSPDGSHASDPPPPLCDACTRIFRVSLSATSRVLQSSLPQQQPCWEKMKTEKTWQIFLQHCLCCNLASSTTPM